MGCNFIRLGHYQRSRLVLEMCDELGLLVWEEIPWCRGGVGGEQYREQARRMLRNMIDQHRNHPSVVFWGLGNENDWPGDFEVFDEKAVRAFMTELNEIAHKADPSRMTAIRRCDFAGTFPTSTRPPSGPDGIAGVHRVQGVHRKGGRRRWTACCTSSGAATATRGATPKIPTP